jgi:hypothetical protein
MRRALVVAIVLLVPASARAEEERASDRPPPPPASESRPGVANETAGVPAQASGWVNASGGAAGGGRLALDGSAMVSPIRRVAIGAGVTSMTDTTTSPWAGAFVQFLEQGSSGIDLTTSARWRAGGPEGAQQLAGRLTVGRTLGPTYFAVNGGFGQGLGARQDVDYEGGGLFFVRLARIVRVGAEGRVRGEAVETYVTAEDTGRPVEVLGGATAGVDLDRVLVQALGGWAWPRGPLPAGPAVLGAATFSF